MKVRAKLWFAAGATVLLALLAARFLHRRAQLHLLPAAGTLLADGREHKVAEIVSAREVDPAEVQITGGRIEARAGKMDVFVRAPVSPRSQWLRITLPGQRFAQQLTFAADARPDARQPGLPDWMPLHTAADRSSFRRWFTTLADHAADAPVADLPPEIADCAALLRYSFREALHTHDDAWAAHAPALERLAIPSVEQWSYPNTPLHAALFRTRPGTFTSGDLTGGAFSQFADAKTLTIANTFLVSRNLRDARPGDLIFFRLLELDSHHHSQYHSMIVTGEHAEWVVYHTGPVSAPDGSQAKGEMRRVLLNDLLRHPDPRWRPGPTNANFLGVYRWDILAEDN